VSEGEEYEADANEYGPGVYPVKTLPSPSNWKFISKFLKVFILLLQS
jgi:hypothetical protein